MMTGCADVFFSTLDAVHAARDLSETPDIMFDENHALSLDVYAPKMADKAPIVVFFYGGSWEGGKRRWYRFVGEALASNGVIVVIPDYRKYPKVKFPAFMQDAALAVEWTRDHAAQFGGDAKKIFMMGHSAGGHIAALLATDARYLKAVDMVPRDLAGIIGLAGAYDFLPYVENEAEIFGNTPRGRHDSQPVNFVSGDEPPMLLLQGANDSEVEPRNAESLAAKLLAVHEPVTLKIYPDVGHSRILLAFSRQFRTTIPTLADTLAFIRELSTTVEKNPEMH
ncbi:alpha/beta hydrolase [Pseudolysobacter antarcticus]|nr:alpha/beta hydrolase [Pseudolysobacter antarcticus]